MILELNGDSTNELEAIDSSMTIESGMTRVKLTTDDIARFEILYKDTD
jgi:hypothetical protein